MKVKELKDALDAAPDDADVDVILSKAAKGCDSIECRMSAPVENARYSRTGGGVAPINTVWLELGEGYDW